MPNKYLCEVVDTDKLCDNIHSMTVICKELAGEAVAGQFFHINCGHSRLLRRPISVCSVNGNAIEFVFEVKGGGTRWLSKRKVGSPVDVLGPLGNGFTLPEGKTVLVGGGIGVPPLFFAADSLKCEAIAILGFRDKDRIILLDEFESTCDKVIVTTDDGSYGVHGSVTLPLQKLLEDEKVEAVLVCGPAGMLKAVADVCKEFNVPCQVSLEERMGCGVGACLVCACETVRGGEPHMDRVCVEGPVFDASAVVWK